MKKLLVISLFISVLLFGCAKIDIEQSIIQYCQTHSEIKLSDITNFEWDTAYVDDQDYGSGEDLKEKYGIMGDFESLESDYLYRLAFCKDGKLVHDAIVRDSYVYFEESVKAIKPDSVFKVQIIDGEFVHLTPTS